jgi:hypothetical protein
MTDRPLARFHNGQLELDRGGVYGPATRLNVRVMLQSFQHKPGPDAERYVRDCHTALTQYEQAMEEAKCEAATH